MTFWPLLAGGSGVQWEFVCGLFENAIYGGRVDNVFDMKVLQSYLRRYFSSNSLSAGGNFNEAISSPLPNSTHIQVWQNSRRLFDIANFYFPPPQFIV